MNVNFATDCIYLQMWMCGLRRCGSVSVLTGYVSANGHKTRHQSEGIVPCGDGLFDVKKIKSSAEKWRVSGLFRRFGLDVTIWNSGLDVRHFGMIFGKWKRVTTNPARLTPIEIGQGVTYKEAKLTFPCKKSCISINFPKRILQLSSGVLCFHAKSISRFQWRLATTYCFCRWNYRG